MATANREVFSRLQEAQNQLYRTTEQLKDTRATGGLLQNLSAIASELDKTQAMLAHIMSDRMWD